MLRDKTPRPSGKAGWAGPGHPQIFHVRLERESEKSLSAAIGLWWQLSSLVGPYKIRGSGSGSDRFAIVYTVYGVATLLASHNGQDHTFQIETVLLTTVPWRWNSSGCFLALAETCSDRL